MALLRLRLSAIRPARLSPSAMAVPRMTMPAMRYSSSKHDNDPDVLAREKARNLSGTQHSSAPHASSPGWNEHLASDAEANIKADQFGPDGKPGKDLQDATIAQTHKHHHDDEAGMHAGAKHHKAKHNPEQTASEDAVKADRGDH